MKRFFMSLALSCAVISSAAAAPYIEEEIAEANIPGSDYMRFGDFGGDTPGGRGGRVIKVTNLEMEGPGSFRDALAQEGKRIIVFEVGGIIDWKMSEFIVANGDLTIAGETAPSPGITVIRGSFIVDTDNVVVRHLRFRLGDGADLKKAKTEFDTAAAQGTKVKNVVFDQVSTAWGIDENLSVSGPRVKDTAARNVTLRNCIVAECLDRSTHPKSSHSKGTLIHDFIQDVGIVGCFFAHNMQRNPLLKPNTLAYYANNLVYDPGDKAVHFANVPKEYETIPDPMLRGRLTAIGNFMRHGNWTPRYLPFFEGWGEVYIDDNISVHRDGKTLAGLRFLGEPKKLQQPPIMPKSDFTPLSARMAERYVLKNAGARPKDRDSVDARLIADYMARQGNIIDSQDEVGGYPTAVMTTRKLEVPDDPDKVEEWLSSFRAEVEF